MNGLSLAALERRRRSYFNSWGNGLLLCGVAGFVLLTPLLLRLNLRRLLPLIDAKRAATRPERPPNPDYIARLERYVDVVTAFFRPLLGSYCLSRGLTLFFFVRRAGLAPTLHFGMGKVAGEFSGHCWLELDGKPFLEKEDPLALFRSVYAYSSARG